MRFPGWDSRYKSGLILPQEPGPFPASWTLFLPSLQPRHETHRQDTNVDIKPHFLFPEQPRTLRCPLGGEQSPSLVESKARSR